MTGAAAAPPATTLPPTDPTAGLATAEVERRRAAGLGNDYRAPTSRGYWEILRDNSYPFVNGPLLVISVLLVVAGAYTEALLTGGPVLMNIAVGVFQGTRAKLQLDRIALLSRPATRVVRDGSEREVDPAEVVVGDVVVAVRGDEIQLDGRVVGEDLASVDESALTGESDPVERGPGDPVLSGSAVLGGRVRYEVEAVGEDTFANRILAQAKRHRGAQTPLQADIARAFVVVAVLIVGAAALVLVTIAALPESSGFDALIAAAVLVTLVPQGLAMMLTVTYAAAALRISRLGALAQRQSAIESISRVDTFCTDKTGTLTTQHIAFAEARPVAADLSPAALERLLAAYAGSTGSPNATTLAVAAALAPEQLAIEGEVAFSSALRWSAVRFAEGDDHPASGRTLVLGAPSTLAPALDGASTAVASLAEELAATGRRVLLFATGSSDAPLDERRDEDLPIPGPLTPLALVTFTEELRPEARATIDGLQARGVDVKVVSGDAPRTVEAVARQVGLEVTDPAASGLELASMAEPELAEVADRTAMFGRVDPELKARLVRALQSRGRYVAMTGDGVNDILPVRTADVGIAMQSGSPATRGVADLVLVHDDFSILPEAILDGQRIVAAMGTTLTVLLARTFYVLLIIVAAALAGYAFPFTPRQNSILAFVTVGVPILVLALWVRPAPSPKGLLGRTLRISIPLSLGVSAVAVPVYGVALESGASVDQARTILVTVSSFMGIGALGLIPVAGDTEGRIRLPAWGRSMLLIAAMVVAYLVVVSVPLGRSFFELTPLSAEVLLTLGAIGAAWTATALLLHRTRVVARLEDALIAWGRGLRGSGGN